MSLTELRDIVKANKTVEHGINIGDEFKINGATKAKIVAINNDYITCMISPPASSLNDVPNAINYESYYKKRQISERNPTAIVGYHNSDLRKRIFKWYAAQSSEFKSVIKKTFINYETYLLHYDIENFRCIQCFCGFEKRTERIFIPTESEMDDLMGRGFIPINKNSEYWTSTPATKNYHLLTDYGAFTSKLSDCSKNIISGSVKCKVILLFNIG